MSSGVTVTNSSTADSSRPFLRSGLPRIPAPCLGENNVSSAEVGSLRFAAPSIPRGLRVLDRKTGWCCSRALVDRVSENHKRRPRRSHNGSMARVPFSPQMASVLLNV
jgi:hypothetical protein